MNAVESAQRRQLDRFIFSFTQALAHLHDISINPNFHPHPSIHVPVQCTEYRVHMLLNGGSAYSYCCLVLRMYYVPNILHVCMYAVELIPFCVDWSRETHPKVKNNGTEHRTGKVKFNFEHIFFCLL